MLTKCFGMFWRRQVLRLGEFDGLLYRDQSAQKNMLIIVISLPTGSIWHMSESRIPTKRVRKNPHSEIPSILLLLVGFFTGWNGGFSEWRLNDSSPNFSIDSGDYWTIWIGHMSLVQRTVNKPHRVREGEVEPNMNCHDLQNHQNPQTSLDSIYFKK